MCGTLRSEPQAERIEERPVQWVRETRVAWGLIRDLARRIGVVQPEEPIPRVIRQQRWSPLNVPLMWAAAGGDDTNPVLDWLVERLRSCEPVVHYGGSMEASVAVRTGWL